MKKKPSKRLLRKLPKISSTDILSTSPIHMHFFTDDCDWYMQEYDRRGNFFYGYTLPHDGYRDGEWGYTSLDSLIESKPPNRSEISWDENWTLKDAFEIEKIKQRHGIIMNPPKINKHYDNINPLRKLTSFFRALYYHCFLG